jgi:hypothetical protein
LPGEPHPRPGTSFADRKTVYLFRYQTMAQTSTLRSPNIRRLLIIGLLTAFIAPAILTSKWVAAPHWYWFHFDDKTGAIGDTFGGITGPILNFVGLILVYYSFKQQLEANCQQQDALTREIDYRNQSDAFNDIKLAIDTFAEDVRFQEQSFRAIA